MKKYRKIYDTDYYKIQFIINNPKFKRKIKKLINTFAKFSCPIPKNGFSNYKEYLRWNDRYFSTRAKKENTKAFKQKIKKITGGKNRWGVKEQTEIEKLEEKELPPFYGSVINKMLSEYDIERTDENYRKFKDFITDYIFFNKKEFTNTPLIVKWIRNKKTNNMELLIQILPHTRKEDVENAWLTIKEEQKYLPKYKQKNKEYKNFHRDLEIYNKYKDLQKTKLKSIGKGDDIYYNKRSDEKISSIIAKKYGDDLSWETIRKIVSDMEKFRKNCGL